MIIVSVGVFFLGYFHFEISQVWIVGLRLLVRSHGVTWIATLAARITFFPQCLGTLRWVRTLLPFVCDRILSDLLHVQVPHLWHVASLNVAVMSFGCPTFMPLSYVGGHNHTYSFLFNYPFGYVVPRLDSRHSSFLGLLFWIHGISAIGLRWMHALESGLLDDDSEGSPLHSITTPLVYPRLIGGEYLYPWVLITRPHFSSSSANPFSTFWSSSSEPFFEFFKKLPVLIACHQHYPKAFQKERILLLIQCLSASSVVVEVSSLLCVAVTHPLHVLCLWWWTDHIVGGVCHWGWALLAHHGSRGASSLGWMGRSPRCCSRCNVVSSNLAKAFTPKVASLWTQWVTRKL